MKAPSYRLSLHAQGPPVARRTRTTLSATHHTACQPCRSGRPLPRRRSTGRSRPADLGSLARPLATVVEAHDDRPAAAAGVAVLGHDVALAAVREADPHEPSPVLSQSGSTESIAIES